MTDALTIICRFDEAVDYESMSEAELSVYRESRDASLLKRIPGETPTVFHARRLRTSEMSQVNALPAVELRYELCFRKALVRVDDLRGPDGSRSTWTRPNPDKPLNDAQIDKFTNAEVQEVGSYIYDWSNVGKGRPAAWQLPATSARALEGLASLRVAQKRASAEASRQSSETAEAVAAAPPAPSPSGGTPGAATATG